MPMLQCLSALLPLVVFAGAQQVPLASFPTQRDSVNLTSLFDSDPMGATSWGAASWNGLNTFARSKPLRCLGVDNAQKYDVAILGTWPYMSQLFGADYSSKVPLSILRQVTDQGVCLQPSSIWFVEEITPAHVSAQTGFVRVLGGWTLLELLYLWISRQANS